MALPRQIADAERDGAVYTCDLTQPQSRVALPGAVARAATAHDAEALRAAMHASGVYAHDVVEVRLRQGRRAYVVETDGKIVSYGWIAYDAEPIGDLGISFLLEPGEAYIYDCATRPEYRGRGYYPALLRTMTADLHDQGLRGAWIGTAPGNVASQRGIVRAGFAKVADINIIRHDDDRASMPVVIVYGVPGVPGHVLRHAAWSFHGDAIPDAGIPHQGRVRS